jgi:hypothetical protein
VGAVEDGVVVACGAVADGAPTTPGEEPELAVVAAELKEVMPWSMEINCCRLFTPTSWLMYAFGSVGCVGS